MKRKTMILFGCSLILSTGFVVLLFLSSFDFSKQDNAFRRQFAGHALFEKDTIDLPYNSYFISGASDNTVYLGNITAPLHVLTLNLNSLTDSIHHTIDVRDISNYKFWSLRLSVDSPYFSLSDGGLPVIFGGTTHDWKADRYMYDSAYFTDAVPISHKSFAIRTVAKGTDDYILGKEQGAEPHITLHPGLLEKQVDGRFCVDGKMVYDRSSNKLIYLYYYRNQYIVMDTSLNLLYRGNTIDTVSWAKLKVGDIKNENIRSLSAPPYLVNKRLAIWNDWLFINSALRATNESMKDFTHASVIDVYDLRTEHYVFSFYIKDFKKKKLIDFIVVSNKLVVLHDYGLMVYTLGGRFDRNQFH